MKKILTILFIIISLSASSQIVADHNCVSEFDSIPEAYLNEVKKMLIWIDGESHSYGYRIGLDSLELDDNTYDVTRAWGFPDHYDDNHLRVAADVTTIGEEEWFTWKAYESSPPAESRYIKNRLLTQVAADNPINVLGFVWCWDMVAENGPTTGTDATLGVHWYGASVGGPDGNNEWGIDDNDYSVTSNSVSLQTYFQATEDYIDFCADSSTATTVIFTTGPVDSYTGEGGYQAYLKNEAIRSYVNSDTSRILFDYADILSYDNNGDTTLTSWDEYDYPIITTDNLGSADVGHIGDIGRMRLAKATWWLLARISGWEGTVRENPLPQSPYGGDYFVSVDGDDLNDGSFSSPWGTWQKAFETAEAGDTVYFRGGTWYPQTYLGATNTVCIIAAKSIVGVYTGTLYGNDGESFANPICYFNYPGETPILDCSQVDTSGHWYNNAFEIYTADYLHLKGLQIRNVYQCSRPNPNNSRHEPASGLSAYVCSNLTFENISVSGVGGRGYSVSSTVGYYNIETDTTSFINCDAYDCADILSETPGNAADGWKVNTEYPSDSDADTMYFYQSYYLYKNCRAWNCSDDGFDPSGSNQTVFDNCWSFYNGYYGETVDGNGFKSGGVQALHDNVSGVTRIVKNCIAAFNGGIGYYDLEYADYARNNSRYYNNISWKDNIGIQISSNVGYPESKSRYYNNVILDPRDRDAGSRPQMLICRSYYQESHNNWDYADSSVVGSLYFWIPTDTVTATIADYSVSDSTQIMNQLKAARKSDGSLPDITCFRLAEGSDLIGAGTDVGMSSTPDIGIDWAWLDAQQAPIPRRFAISRNNKFTISRNGNFIKY